MAALRAEILRVVPAPVSVHAVGVDVLLLQ